MNKFKIQSFASGLDLQSDEGLLKPYQALIANNVNIDSGALCSTRTNEDKADFNSKIHSLIVAQAPVPDTRSGDLYSPNAELLVGDGDWLRKANKVPIRTISGLPLDYVNFEYNGVKSSIITSAGDQTFLYNGKDAYALKNRRPSYDDKGELDGYYDANGIKHKTEDLVQTYAPFGDFIELHFDRLWIAGDPINPDRLYFSTANVNGADIQDWTIPMDEENVNMHGGFLDVRSYDGGKIIGLKVAFGSICIFKEKTAYKIYGNSPSNYQLVELFNSTGAISDKSIVVGNNGIYYLNVDGIYYFDGTNSNLISSKITPIIKSMSVNDLSKAIGWIHDNKYHLSIPNDLGTHTMIVFDFETNSFITNNFTDVSAVCNFNNKMLYARDNIIYGIADGQESMHMVWETPWYDFSLKNARKMSTYLYFRGSGDGKVKFTLITEKKTKELIVDLTGLDTLYKRKLKAKGRMFKIIIENVDGSNVRITSPELICEVDED